MYSIPGGVIAAACLCLSMSNGDVTASMGVIPFALGGFMVTNTVYHFGKLRWNERLVRWWRG
jgi:hypothetical protein